MVFSSLITLSPSSYHRRVQSWVSGTRSEHRPYVGKPTEDETRKALVESNGEERNAVNVIYGKRREKVHLFR